ncbi:uncharacterized protein LOC124818979 isoform X1 [Hydra vulgaris]|uniref:uncharacterized protein LOC124818979 isoform X1 n=1 Tax=Hydra vulgaris TaxID=6087 RepID=UPI0032EA5F5B
MAEIIRNPIFQYNLSELLKNDWYYIGIILDIEERDLESIRDDVKFKNSQEKAYGMLKCFINKEKPTLDKLKDAIKKIGKNALLNDVNNLEDSFMEESSNSQDNTNKRNSSLKSDSIDLDSNRASQRRIRYGSIFKFDLHGDKVCTLVEYKFNKRDNWSSINNTKQSRPYYLTRKKNNEMFIKVESLICEANVYFRFSFQDLNNKVVYEECISNITGECDYELSYNGMIMIATPAPISDNEFSENIRAPKSLDWRKTFNINLIKVPENESIESIADIYIDRNFPDLKDVIYVRSFFACKDFATMIFDKFYVFFSEKKRTGIRAILPGYHIRNHASLLKCNIESFKNHTDEDRIIIFYSELNLILIARIATSLDRLQLESENCLNDTTLFVTVNSLLINCYGLVILGVVVLPLIKREELKEELFFIFSDSSSSQKKFEKILFLCKDDIQNENFECWWRLVSAYSIERCNVQSTNTLFFKKLIGLAMIVMAKVDMVNNNINIPTLMFDPQKQIESIILNYEQYESIHDKELKKIITGGYGSGKSIVGKEIVKNCITKQYEHPLTLYYICCNHFSLYQCEMKEFVDKIFLEKTFFKKTPNVTVVCDNLYELWQKMCIKKRIKEEYISIPRLLEYLVVTDKNNVCFVLEELSHDYVKHEDAIQLNKLFLNTLKESLVVFIPESVEKYREIIRNNEKQIIQKNCFNEETLDMKIFTLKKSMRVTECIKFLIDSSQNSICESKTVFNFPNSKVDEKSEIIKKDLCKKNKQILHQNSKASITDLDNTFENYFFDGDVNHISNKVEKSTVDLTENGFHDYDFDHVSKYVAIKTNNEVSSCSMETSFGFKSSIIGHSIKGEKPKVVFFPFHDLKKKQSAIFLSVVLQYLFFNKLRKTVVICNDMEETQSVAYAIDITEKYKSVIYLPHLQKRTPKFSEKFEVTKKLTSNLDILVTDSKGFSGAESECVVVLVRPDEIYLRHVLVDAMSRSNSYLIVLVLNSNNKDQNLTKNLNTNGTIRNVLNKWSENIAEKIIVNVCNKKNQAWTEDINDMIIVHVCNKENLLLIQTDCSILICEHCKDFIDRGSIINFSSYGDKIEFKIFDENNAIYESIASNIQANKGNDMDELFIENLKKVRVVGSGASGTVYLCTDENTGRRLAMKCIETGDIDNNVNAKQEFEKVQDEISLFQTLNHERIVHYFGSTYTNTTVSIVMEFMEGGSLYNKISNEGALDENTASEKSYQILCGLEYLHSKNIVHRDIKSANILLDLYGNCKLADFGISKQIQTISSCAGCKTFAGTPYWMSPEVINATADDIEYRNKADIWSFGCTVLEMLTTKPPWFHLDPRVAIFHIGTKPTIPHLPDNSSNSCTTFVNDCFQRDPKLRPNTSQLLTYDWVKRSA